MGLIEDAPNPIEYLREVRDRNQARQQKAIFFEEQFQKMVENGNVEKAVELIYDEAKNLDARLNKDISPADLAHHCVKKCKEVRENKDKESFEEAVRKLRDEYEVSVES